MCTINLDNIQESYIQVLQAEHGDALILYCNKSDKRGAIVIDGGPSPNPRFNPFVKEVENCLPIDLMILTHFDDDHLVGIKNFIERHQNDVPFPVKRIWANCAKHVDFDTSENLSSNKASKMADVLCAISQKSELDWESYRLDGFVDDTITFADIDIINPRKELFKYFIDNYKKEYDIRDSEENLSNRRNSNLDINIDHCCPEKFYHKVSCTTEPVSGTLTGTVG